MSSAYDTQRWLNDLLRGRSSAVGVFALISGTAVSTTVVRTGTAASSVVIPSAYAGLASNADITSIVPTRDAFTVFHSASVATRTFRYIFLTGVES